MPDPIITNNDSSELVLGDDFYKNDIFTAGGAATFKKGMILARDSVTGKLVVFVKGGVTQENDIPKTVLPFEVVAAGAGDITVRVFTTARLRKDKLVINADGDDSNVDAVVIDELRDYGIFSEDVTELNIPDNQ